MNKLFTEHPHLAGETYWQHFRFALGAGMKMMVAGVICILHGCFPFIFEHTASNIIIPLAKQLETKVEEVKQNKKTKGIL
jgi:hypothetical protein